MQKWVAYLFTVFLFISCGKDDSQEDERRVFRMNLASGLRTLDPAFAKDQASIWMTGQVFNGLVSYDENLNIQPAIATHWEVSDSGKTYTFFLRGDVFFHKDPLFGSDSTRKVVASDFLYSFSRICDPDVASPGFWIFNGKVDGIEAFREGNAPDISGFEVLNDSVFQIHLKQAFPPFIGVLAMAYSFVVPKEIVAHYGKDFRGHPIGTGPFKLKRWREGRSLILHRNPGYFKASASDPVPFLDAVQVRFIRSRLSEFIELLEGRLDFVNGLDKSFKDELFLPSGGLNPDYSSRFQFQRAPQLNTEFIGFLVDTANALLRNHPLRDARVRKAMNYAIDRDRLVRFLLNGNGYPASSGMIPQGMPGFSDSAVKGFRYDPDLAAELLREAGYPDGSGIPVLSLKSNPSYQAVMEFIQKSWERIGIPVEIDNMDGATLREQASKGEILMWRASWIADYPDGENYLGLFSTANIPPGGSNRMRFSHPRFDSLFQAVLYQNQDSVRYDLYHQMERLILSEAPVVLLYYDRILRIISQRITDLRTNAMNMLYLERVKKN